MPVSLVNDWTIELLPPSDLRILPGLERPAAASLDALTASLRRHGILLPLVVRPALPTFVVQAGRRRGRRGFFVIDPRARKGNVYADEPPFFATRPEAVRHLPADKPWEICDGVARWLAARRLKMEYLPCLLTELSDEQVLDVRRVASVSPVRPLLLTNEKKMK